MAANVNGGGAFAVNFQMDGAGHNDTYVRTNLPFPNPDAVKEFNVQTDNVSAQYGSGAGAVVNIVTQSGTNEIHGNLFEFVRNGDFNARNFFAPIAMTRSSVTSMAGPWEVRSSKTSCSTLAPTRARKFRSAAQGNIQFVPTADERAGNFAGSGITGDRSDHTSKPFPNDQIPTNQISSLRCPILFEGHAVAQWTRHASLHSCRCWRQHCPERRSIHDQDELAARQEPE